MNFFEEVRYLWHFFLPIKNRSAFWIIKNKILYQNYVWYIIMWYNIALQCDPEKIQWGRGWHWTRNEETWMVPWEHRFPSLVSISSSAKWERRSYLIVWRSLCTSNNLWSPYLENWETKIISHLKKFSICQRTLLSSRAWNRVW